MVLFVNEQVGQEGLGWGALPPEGSLTGNRMTWGSGGIKERRTPPAEDRSELCKKNGGNSCRECFRDAESHSATTVRIGYEPITIFSARKHAVSANFETC
jgi:hypothetical protein